MLFPPQNFYLRLRRFGIVNSHPHFHFHFQHRLGICLMEPARALRCIFSAHIPRSRLYVLTLTDLTVNGSCSLWYILSLPWMRSFSTISRMYAITPRSILSFTPSFSTQLVSSLVCTLHCTSSSASWFPPPARRPSCQNRPALSANYPSIRISIASPSTHLDTSIGRGAQRTAALTRREQNNCARSRPGFDSPRPN